MKHADGLVTKRTILLFVPLRDDIPDEAVCGTDLDQIGNPALTMRARDRGDEARRWACDKTHNSSLRTIARRYSRRGSLRDRSRSAAGIPGRNPDARANANIL